ncbi:alpha/beta-hydrolase, partial [Lophium mytilinum]
MSVLAALFQPLYDSVFSTLPFHQRWRLFLIQPITLLAEALTLPPLLLSRKHHTITIPTRHGPLRALLFRPPSNQSTTSCLHPSAFISGLPSTTAPFCTHLSTTTSTIAVSATYRLAPRHPFPAAIDDVDDAVTYLLSPAFSTYLRATHGVSVDTALFTLSGQSAGANLALAACAAPALRGGKAKAVVGYYAPVDLRVPPWEKEKSEGMYGWWDPLGWAMPLFDAYAGPVREGEGRNPRLSPVLMEVGELPRDLLLVVPSIDVLVVEQLGFVERVRRE